MNAAHKGGLPLPEKTWKYLHVKNGRGKLFAIHNLKKKKKGSCSQFKKFTRKGYFGRRKKNPPNTLSLIEVPISLSSSKEMDCRRKGTSEPDTLWSRMMGLQSSLQCVLSSD